MAQIHANRLQVIDYSTVESEDPSIEVFLDSRRIFGKTADYHICKNNWSSIHKQLFKAQMGLRHAQQWAKESDLPETVENLYNRAKKEQKLNIPL